MDLPPRPEFKEVIDSLSALRGERLDVAAEARWVMTAVGGRAAWDGVRLELAIVPGVEVWMDRCAFRKLLAELVGQAVAMPCSRVLLTAASHGGRTQIGVSHNGAGKAREEVEAAIRPAMDIAALSGGSSELRVRSDQGCTVLVKLPQPALSSRRSSWHRPRSARAAARLRRRKRLPS